MSESLASHGFTLDDEGSASGLPRLRGRRRGALLSVASPSSSWQVGYGRCSVRHCRRLRFVLHQTAVRARAEQRDAGLDQIPESLFPAVACSAYLQLGPLDIAVIVLVFSVGEQAMSRLFFAAGLRDRPY